MQATTRVWLAVLAAVLACATWPAPAGATATVVAVAIEAPAAAMTEAAKAEVAKAGPDESAVDAVAPAAATGAIPADTAIWLETMQPLSSATLKRGESFALRVAEPVMVDGVVVVPAGTACHGEVIHADRSRGGGRAGELLLAARYIELDGRRVGLRGFRIAATGQQKMGATMTVALVGGPLAFFVRGTEIEIPAGTRAQARVAGAAAAPAVSPPPAPPAQNISQPSASAERSISGEVVQ
ncbi:hypothetical protein RDV84_24455 [Lysobacter yananisis]|uniref:Uncharacterized protein n=1 Tax=Lysobacter yananisis TaxID=1003114 RepID=A0ABY9P7M6_9GAMM|nr:hypothetical protein [Lysobacter yananisis]WMT03068.1 hypothetical protein RDV84_24455 [Lysobacter yananisis]